MRSALNCVLPIDNHVFATGDDSGALKVWDLRKGDTILEARQQEEYISAMAADANGKILLTASGDGTLGVFNMKRRRFELLSEPQNGDLTSVVLLKKGKKVACGSSEGTIYLFNWDGFGATSDRFALRAESVDCMVPITESIVCMGSLDGVIRAVNVLPNRVLGCVGQHPGEPIEQLPPATPRTAFNSTLGWGARCAQLLGIASPALSGINVLDPARATWLTNLEKNTVLVRAAESIQQLFNTKSNLSQCHQGAGTPGDHRLG
nr:PREDICTED: WD repeat-containing protein 55 [Opisthocomus hoazin]